MTDPGGEVVALDSAGYGAVTILKSISLISAPGAYAGISATTGTAITIATAGVNVVLRGLNVNAIGAMIGVDMSDGASLTIENCVFSNFSQYGVRVSGPASVRVADSVVRGSGLDGIYLQNGAKVDIQRVRSIGNGQSGVYVSTGNLGTTTTTSVSDSDLSNNNWGAIVSGGNGTGRLSVSRVTVTNNVNIGIFIDGSSGTALGLVSSSLVTGNGTGFFNNGGTFESLGNNTLGQNGLDVNGTVTTISGT